jgi:hypothetical protein
LIAFGCSIERAVLILYAISSIFLLLAFGVFWSQRRLLPIFVGFLFLILLVAGRSFGFSKDWFSMGSHLGKASALRRETRYVFTLSEWLDLEAERRGSIYGLWQDYQFVVNKMGFSKVRLALPDGEESWQVKDFDGTKGTLQHMCHKMANGWSIEFTAEKAVLSDDLFELLAELAAETWHKAAIRWHKLNKVPVGFSASSETPSFPSYKKFIRSYSPVRAEIWSKACIAAYVANANELPAFLLPEIEAAKTSEYAL